MPAAARCRAPQRWGLRSETHQLLINPGFCRRAQHWNFRLLFGRLSRCCRFGSNRFRLLWCWLCFRFRPCLHRLHSSSCSPRVRKAPVQSRELTLFAPSEQAVAPCCNRTHSRCWTQTRDGVAMPLPLSGDWAVTSSHSRRELPPHFLQTQMFRAETA